VQQASRTARKSQRLGGALSKSERGLRVFSASAAFFLCRVDPGPVLRVAVGQWF